jgi:hypothetical protein
VPLDWFEVLLCPRDPVMDIPQRIARDHHSELTSETNGNEAEQEGSSYGADADRP